MLELRKTLPLYFRAERGAAKLRMLLQEAKSYEALQRIILDIEHGPSYNNMNREFVPENKENL